MSIARNNHAAGEGSAAGATSSSSPKRASPSRATARPASSRSSPERWRSRRSTTICCGRMQSRRRSRASRRRNGAKKRRPAAVILPDYAARVSVLDFDSFPSSPEEQLSLVRFRVKKTIPFDIDSAAVSYWVQPADQGRREEDRSGGGHRGAGNPRALRSAVPQRWISPRRGHHVGAGRAEPVSRRERRGRDRQADRRCPHGDGASRGTH